MKVPENVLEKFFAMTGLIILFLAACSNRLHAPAINHDMPKTIYLTHIVTVHDTIPLKSKKLYSDDKLFKERLNRLMERSDVAFDDINQMKTLNIEWQKNYMLLLERARTYRYGNDSLSVLIKDIRSDQLVANKKAEHYYKQFQEAQEAKKQYETLDKGINWQVYSGFIVIILFLGAIQWKLKKMGPAQREKLNYL